MRNFKVKDLLNITLAVGFLTLPPKIAVNAYQQRLESQADLMYQNANKVWDAAVAANDPLIRGFNARNFLLDSPEIVRKYCSSSGDGKPKVLPHEEFEKQKEGKQVLYRGIADGTKLATDYSQQLKYGEYFNGFENNGIFASIYGKMADLPKTGGRWIGVITSEMAEYYTHGKGVICRFFFDQSEVNAISLEESDAVIKAYREKYLPSFRTLNEEYLKGLSAKELFLHLCFDFGQSREIRSLLLGAKVLISQGGCRYQIFDRTILTVDEQDEDIVFEDGEGN
jgi:hypothetical protein